MAASTSCGRDASTIVVGLILQLEPLVFFFFFFFLSFSPTFFFFSEGFSYSSSHSSVAADGMTLSEPTTGKYVGSMRLILPLLAYTCTALSAVRSFISILLASKSFVSVGERCGGEVGGGGGNLALCFL